MASTDLNIPIAKAKGYLTITKDELDALPEGTYREILLQGCKAVLGRGMSKITGDTYPNEEERKTTAMAVAQKNWEACKAGEIRITGGKSKKPGQGAIMVEARRLARQAVKDALKDAGEKISHYEAKDITALANELIEQDESFVETATKNIEERKAKPVAKSILAGIKVSDKKVKAAQAKKEKLALAGLSVKQAGLTAKARPQA